VEAALPLRCVIVGGVEIVFCPRNAGFVLELAAGRTLATSRCCGCNCLSGTVSRLGSAMISLGRRKAM
jgi:hypothetical protein